MKSNPNDIIESKHIKFAIDYIRKNGDTHRNNAITLRPKTAPDNYCLVHNKAIYATREIVRTAYVRALEDRGELRQQCEKFNQEIPSDFSWDNVSDIINLGWLWKDAGGDNSKKLLKKHGYTIMSLPITEELQAEEGNNMPDDSTNDETDERLKLFRQFKQVIFYGPPGTGKTFTAKQNIAKLLGVDDNMLLDLQGNRWDIVQFHPSYNYEDFVRGVQVKTDKEGKVNYTTQNRIFADMCQKASDDEDNDYALIIDEINRANVSSVLGELIYALEYRDEPVSTPYAINGDNSLTIPPNLYIIGTMNTADRTIGAIDYAVRRRFAFEHCPPDESLITNDWAKSMFRRVNNMFAHDKFLSPDFDAKDVKIGHSYFMAENDDDLPNKIKYQVIPILREYVKDGVLLPEAEEEINFLATIEFNIAHPPLNPNEIAVPTNGPFTWEKDGRGDTDGVGRTVYGIIKDYVTHNNPNSLEELQAAFPNDITPGHRRTVANINDNDVEQRPERYFTNEYDRIDLQGNQIVICREWGAPGVYWHRFVRRARELGYTITGSDA